MKTIGEKIKEQRVRLNKTQTELASETNLTIRSISCYETGKATPRGSTIRRLCSALHVSEAYLLNSEIDDPSYGLEEEPYIESVRSKYGKGAALDLQSLMEANRQLFAGGDVPQEDKDLFFRAIVEAYMGTKQDAHDRFTPKKYKDEE